MLKLRKFLAMGYDSNFDDVQDEMHSMRRARRENRTIVWMVVPIAFLAHVAALTLIVLVTTWMFGDSPAVVGVTCSAYVSAVLGWALQRTQQRADQTALHATSIHDEVLKVKELIQDKQTGSVQWRSYSSCRTRALRDSKN